MVHGLVLVSPAQRLALGTTLGEAELLQSFLGDPNASRNGFGRPRGLRLLYGGGRLVFRALSYDFTRVPGPNLDAIKRLAGDFQCVRAWFHRSSPDYTAVVEGNDVLS